jgi:hypothetical protein
MLGRMKSKMKTEQVDYEEENEFIFEKKWSSKLNKYFILLLIAYALFHLYFYLFSIEW